jgi:WD40 repeat protein
MKNKFLLFHLIGHSKAVWAIISIGDVTNNSKIILTGSADHSIIAWKNQTKFQTYEGTQLVLPFQKNRYDFLSFYLSDHQLFSFFSLNSGHTDCVRSLAALNSNEFLSCSNDNTIKRWNVSSVRCLQTYEGHTNFVYDLTVISPELFASASEDRSLRLWSINKSESIQTIRLPTPTAWCVCTLTNGDIVAGCR